MGSRRRATASVASVALIAAAVLAAACGGGPTTEETAPSIAASPTPSVPSWTSVVIPSHSPVPPRPRSPEVFSGLGTWVDVYDHVDWQHPASAVSSMAAHGVDTLYVQTSNFNKDYDVFHPAALSIFIEEAHAAGIDVVAWYLPGLADMQRDLDRSLAAMGFETPSGQRFDGFGLDIEAQVLDPPGVRSQALLDLSRQIAEAAQGFPLAAITPSPVALQMPPNGWPNFPWDGLNAYYDAFVPMDYFVSRAHGRRQVHDYVVLSARIIRGATGDAGVPIAPIGGIARAVSAREARGFVDAIEEEGLLGGSLYDFRTTTDAGVWSELSRLSRSGTPGGSPGPS